MSNFYIVQREGVPAIWQADPQRIAGLLRSKSKVGYRMAAETPANSRTEALYRLRELFPNVRVSKASHKASGPALTS